MQLLNDIKQILNTAKQNAYKEINKAMVYAYWLIGERIVKEEQDGQIRATYGKAIIKNLSEQLTVEFGKGFSIDNLENMRRFYLTYSISETASRNSFYCSLYFSQIAFLGLVNKKYKFM